MLFCFTIVMEKTMNFETSLYLGAAALCLALSRNYNDANNVTAIRERANEAAKRMKQKREALTPTFRLNKGTIGVEEIPDAAIFVGGKLVPEASRSRYFQIGFNDDGWGRWMTDAEAQRAVESKQIGR
jgi:hypothetical protein